MAKGADRVVETFFGFLWGLSIPALLFSMIFMPDGFSDMHAGHWSAGLVTGAATVAGWFRTGELVRKRCARPGDEMPARQTVKKNGSARGWAKFGAMPYMAGKFGVFSILFLTVMLFFSWFGLRLFTGGQVSGAGRVETIQVGMYVTIMTLICYFHISAQVRGLQVLPMSRRALAGWLVIWPFSVSVVAVVYCHCLQHLVFHSVISWSTMCLSILGNGFLMLIVPLVLLRTGLKIWVYFLVSFVGMMGQVSGEMLGQFWPGFGEQHTLLLLALAAMAVAAGWYGTYRTLGTTSPWRAGLAKWSLMSRGT